jgi:hypothetical protein
MDAIKLTVLIYISIIKSLKQKQRKLLYERNVYKFFVEFFVTIYILKDEHSFYKLILW